MLTAAAVPVETAAATAREAQSARAVSAACAIRVMGHCPASKAGDCYWAVYLGPGRAGQPGEAWRCKCVQQTASKLGGLSRTPRPASRPRLCGPLSGRCPADKSVRPPPASWHGTSIHSGATQSPGVAGLRPTLLQRVAQRACGGACTSMYSSAHSVHGAALACSHAAACEFGLVRSVSFLSPCIPSPLCNGSKRWPAYNSHWLAGGGVVPRRGGLALLHNFHGRWVFNFHKGLSVQLDGLPRFFPVICTPLQQGIKIAGRHPGQRPQCSHLPRFAAFRSSLSVFPTGLPLQAGVPDDRW